MTTESRGPESNPTREGAVNEDDPESTGTKSPPRPPSDPDSGKPLASPPRRRRSRSNEETSKSDSGSALGSSARRRKRKRVTEPRVLSTTDSAGSNSDSACSSPFRRPKAPLSPLCTDADGTVIYTYTSDQAVLDKYCGDMRKYEKKSARQKQLLTLGRSNFTERRTLKETEAILNYSKSVLSVSAYLDGKMINQCTGIVVEVDAFKNSNIILTSASIFCTKTPLDDWTPKDYVPEAKVKVHMLNDSTTLDCSLLFFSKHYELAFFKITGTIQLKSLLLEPNVEFGQEVCLLARETNMDLIYRKDKVQFLDPCEHQHNHYQFVNGPLPECGSGGALLDTTGKAVGMLFFKLPLVAFIRSSLILKCSAMWQHFGQIARPQLGLKIRTLGFLDISRIELMSRKFNISSGLIVREISAKCDAEKLGIRVGDVILSCQKERVSSIVQLEGVLMSVGEKYLEKSNDLSSKVDVEIGVFHVRKCIESVITIRVELSDCLEVFHSDVGDTEAEGSKGEGAPAAAAGEAMP